MIQNILNKMLEILLIITVALFIIVYLFPWLKTTYKRRKILNLIPGPSGYPIIGNLLLLYGDPEQLWKYFRGLARKYQTIYTIRNAHISSVSLLSPDDIEVILSSKEHLRKTKIYEWLQPWLGTGLLTSAGDKWQCRRKIITPAFHFNILQEFVEIFKEQSDLLVQQLQHECRKPYTNLIPIITQFALHSICETAMGTKLEEANEKTQQYVKAVYRIGELLLNRVTQPWLFINKIYHRTAQYHEQTKLLNILHNFTLSVIEERKLNYNEVDTTLNKNSKKRLALLDLLLSAKNSGMQIDNAGIREEVDTFMFEGHDTTTAAISFTLMILANHPDIQEKVVQELLEVCENQQLEFQDFSKLRYLEQVIKESLRLYPSVPTIARITDSEVHTPSGYTIPANCFIHIHIFDLHHNPNIYPDPYKFDPDRFSPENSRHRHPFAYLPFSAGSRNCIGQKFAILEIKTVIAAILRNFVLTAIDTPSDVKIVTHLVLKTQNGIKVKFTERIY